MLKKLSTSLWLLCFVSAAYAQEDDQETEESKRPSWSAGLPEREKPADLNKPSFRPDRDEEIELDMSEFGLQPKPEIEIELIYDTSEENDNAGLFDQATQFDNPESLITLLMLIIIPFFV